MAHFQQSNRNQIYPQFDFNNSVQTTEHDQKSILNHKHAFPRD